MKDTVTISDLTLKAIEESVKEEVENRLVNEIMEDIRGNITMIVRDKLEEVTFDSFEALENPLNMAKSYHLLVHGIGNKVTEMEKGAILDGDGRLHHVRMK